VRLGEADGHHQIGELRHREQLEGVAAVGDHLVLVSVIWCGVAVTHSEDGQLTQVRWQRIRLGHRVGHHEEPRCELVEERFGTAVKIAWWIERP
jgi:hypothetical protein